MDNKYVNDKEINPTFVLVDTIRLYNPIVIACGSIFAYFLILRIWKTYNQNKIPVKPEQEKEVQIYSKFPETIFKKWGLFVEDYISCNTGGLYYFVKRSDLKERNFFDAEDSIHKRIEDRDAEVYQIKNGIISRLKDSKVSVFSPSGTSKKVDEVIVGINLDHTPGDKKSTSDEANKVLEKKIIDEIKEAHEFIKKNPNPKGIEIGRLTQYKEELAYHKTGMFSDRFKLNSNIIKVIAENIKFKSEASFEYLIIEKDIGSFENQLISLCETVKLQASLLNQINKSLNLNLPLKDFIPDSVELQDAVKKYDSKEGIEQLLQECWKNIKNSTPKVPNPVDTYNKILRGVDQLEKIDLNSPYFVFYKLSEESAWQVFFIEESDNKIIYSAQTEIDQDLKNILKSLDSNKPDKLLENIKKSDKRKGIDFEAIEDVLEMGALQFKEKFKFAEVYEYKVKIRLLFWPLLVDLTLERMKNNQKITSFKDAYNKLLSQLPTIKKEFREYQQLIESLKDTDNLSEDKLNELKEKRLSMLKAYDLGLDISEEEKQNKLQEYFSNPNQYIPDHNFRNQRQNSLTKEYMEDAEDPSQNNQEMQSKENPFRNLKIKKDFGELVESLEVVVSVLNAITLDEINKLLLEPEIEIIADLLVKAPNKEQFKIFFTNHNLPKEQRPETENQDQISIQEFKKPESTDYLACTNNIQHDGAQTKDIISELQLTNDLGRAARLQIFQSFVSNKGSSTLPVSFETMERDILKKFPKLKVTNVEGDGNCFFRAVSEQLKLIKHSMKGLTYQQLRQLTVKELKDSSGRYIKVFPNENAYKAYIERMERDEEWADGTLISALCNQLKISIIKILYDQNGNLDIDKTDFLSDRETIYLGYTGNHYFSIADNTNILGTYSKSEKSNLLETNKKEALEDDYQKAKLIIDVNRIDNFYDDIKIKNGDTENIKILCKKLKGLLVNSNQAIMFAISLMDGVNFLLTGNRLRDTQKLAILLFVGGKYKIVKEEDKNMFIDDEVIFYSDVHNKLRCKYQGKGSFIEKIAEDIGIPDEMYKSILLKIKKVKKSCAVIASSFDTENIRGHISQIKTGEGKTTIISFIAALKVLQGQKVDIITSNEVLAAEGLRDKRSFYQVLGINVAHNNADHSYIEGPRKCYEADIVYGSITNFQFDYLRHYFEKLETLGKENNERNPSSNWVILDEVDSLLVDQGGNIAKLSSPLPGMESLRYLYINIWIALHEAELKVSSEGKKKLEDKVEEYNDQIKENFKEALNNKLSENQQELSDEKQNEVFDKLIEEHLECTENLVDDDLKNMLKDLKAIKKACLDLKEELATNYYNDIKEELKSHKEEIIEKKIIANYLHKYVDDHLDVWIDNAFLAKYEYEEFKQYKIGTNESHEEEIIVPVDNVSTGVTMKNTILSNGLHHFLEIKHNLALNFESLTSSYISNIGYISKYQNKILGLTGTLGSEPEQLLLSDAYNLDFSIIPTFKTKRFKEITGNIVSDNQFIEKIALLTLSKVVEPLDNNQRITSKARAVLIICDNEKDVVEIETEIKKQLEKFKEANVSIITYKDEKDAHVTLKEYKPGDVVIATNIAGRGSDFKTNDELEQNGGIHVIVAFLPRNKRIEDQALGRTARQGKAGSGQIIARSRELAVFGTDLFDGIDTNEEKFKKVIEYRDLAEKSRIDDVRENQLIEIVFKDKIFEKFLAQYSGIKEKLKNESDRKWEYIARDLKEKWAFWFEEQNDHFQKHLIQDMEDTFSIIKSELDEEKKSNIDKLDGKQLYNKVFEGQLKTKLPLEITVIDKYKIIKKIFDYNYISEDKYQKIAAYILNEEYEKFEKDEITQKILAGNIAHNPYYSIALAEEYLDIGDSENLIKAKVELDNAIQISDNSDLLYSAFIKKFELAIETGGQYFERYKEALAKVFCLYLVGQNQDYKKDSIDGLIKAKVSISIEKEYISKLMYGQSSLMDYWYTKDDIIALIKNKYKIQDAVEIGSETDTNSQAAITTEPKVELILLDQSSNQDQKDHFAKITEEKPILLMIGHKQPANSNYYWCSGILTKKQNNITLLYKESLSYDEKTALEENLKQYLEDNNLKISRLDTNKDFGYGISYLKNENKIKEILNEKQFNLNNLNDLASSGAITLNNLNTFKEFSRYTDILDKVVANKNYKVTEKDLQSHKYPKEKIDNFRFVQDEEDFSNRYLGIIKTYRIIEGIRLENSKVLKNAKKDNSGTDDNFDQILIGPSTKTNQILSMGHGYLANDFERISKKLLQLSDNTYFDHFKFISDQNIENLDLPKTNEMGYKPIYMISYVNKKLEDKSLKYWFSLCLFKFNNEIYLIYRKQKDDASKSIEAIINKIKAKYSNINEISLENSGGNNTDTEQINSEYLLATGPLAMNDLERIFDQCFGDKSTILKEDNSRAATSIVDPSKNISERMILSSRKEEDISKIRKIHCDAILTSSENFFHKHLNARISLINLYSGNIDSLIEQIKNEEENVAFTLGGKSSDFLNNQKELKKIYNG
jgi:hypothetical protein